MNHFMALKWVLGCCGKNIALELEHLPAGSIWTNYFVLLSLSFTCLQNGNKKGIPWQSGG